MCYSLPTAEDPFNDRHGKKELPKKKKKPPPPPPPKKKIRKEKNPASPNPDKKVQAGSSAAVAVPAVKLGPKSGGDDYGCPSKFLILCLNAIRDSWMDEGWLDESADGSLLLSSTWGVDLWRCFSARSNVLDTSGACSSREQIAWLVSAASDIITRKEKQGLVVKCPFLLFLVPSQEKAIQVSRFSSNSLYHTAATILSLLLFFCCSVCSTSIKFSGKPFFLFLFSFFLFWF